MTREGDEASSQESRIFYYGRGLGDDGKVEALAPWRLGEETLARRHLCTFGLTLLFNS